VLDVALQGTIDSFPIVDVLQLLASSGKTGRLDLVGDRGRAALWISDGELVAGIAQGRSGSDPAQALWELLRYSDGSFEFLDEDLPATSGFEPASVTQMIEQATRMQGEWEQIERRVPSLSHRVALAPQLPSGEVRLSADDWAVLVAAGPGPSVASLIEQAGLEEFEGCRRVAEMVDRGLLGVEVATVAAYTPPDAATGVPDPGAVMAEVPSTAPDDGAGAGVQDATVTGGQGDTASAHPVASSGEIDSHPAADAFASGAGAPPATVEPAAVAVEAGIEMAVAPPHPVGGGPSPQPVPEPAPASFPEHFPIDDLVPAPEAGWEPTPPEAMGGGLVDPPAVVGARPDQVFAPEPDQVPNPGHAAAPPPAQERMQQPHGTGGATGFDGFPATEPGQPAQPVPQVGEPPEDDVLAQIGRLSPKAAEAIAAALGDGAERGPAG
jgi:hypothetical protein